MELHHQASLLWTVIRLVVSVHQHCLLVIGITVAFLLYQVPSCAQRGELDPLVSSYSFPFEPPEASSLHGQCLFISWGVLPSDNEACIAYHHCEVQQMPVHRPATINVHFLEQAFEFETSEERVAVPKAKRSPKQLMVNHQELSQAASSALELEEYH